MGIKGWNTFLKEKAGGEIHELVPLHTLQGQAVAVDAFNWMWVHLNVAHKTVVNSTDVAVLRPNRSQTIREWLRSASESLLVWLRYRITPVFVFDGTTPEEKTKTKEERKAKQDKVKDELEQLMAEVEKLDILERDTKVLERIRHLMRQGTFPTTRERKIFRDFLEALGLPCLTARGDGEALCSMLAMEGLVAGVFSTDTDNIVYGCPKLFSSVEWGSVPQPDGSSRTGHCFRTCTLDRTLQVLDLTFEQMQQLAVMMGCDYNTNIPGYGPKKSYALLKAHGSIDALPLSSEKVCVLNHQRCLELFARHPSDDLIEETNSPNLKINKSRDPDVVSSFGVAPEVLTRVEVALDRM